MHINPPIFIGRQSKSGGSLLRKLIGQHKNIYGGDGFETGWFMDDIRINWRDDDNQRQKWLREWLEVDKRTADLLKESSLSGVDYFNKFMEYCTIRANKNRWIENSPGNINHFELISSNWNDFKFIHCVREYKDTYASWKTKNLGSLRDKSVHDFVDIVRNSYVQVESYLGKETNTYIEIKYEDTVCHTEKTLRKVINFIGEEWIDGLHEYSGSDTDINKCRQVIKKECTTSDSLRKPIFTSRIGHWVDEISLYEAEVIDNELNNYSEIFGYL
jgi:protein-tyrosine sulfotransferase